MKQITLCLALHNHQPVGNFPWVFEEAYRQSYRPMIECLERHPGVRVSLHYSGPLLDWLRLTHPEFLRRVAEMVARGQAELMTGGYYEPILPAIPEADRVGQIRKMTDYLVEEFGATATGTWLAERVWEPQLASTLNQAKVEWTIVDDTHFKLAGLTDDDLTGYYLTEDQGQTVRVFATSKRLRYVIPWAPVEEVIAELAAAAGEDPSLVAVMGDDGEKFGVWPGTYDHCWSRGWMDRFFRVLEENSSWIHLMPIGDYARANTARGRIYLPTSSYAEMLEWALPAGAAEAFHDVTHEMQTAHRDDVLRFLRGGFWRNFLVKYAEVNNMHKKMLRAHRKAYATMGSDGASGPDSVALDELWQAQCNCPYWHGVFGGIYMTDVRTANFHHLIRSESRSDELLHGAEPWISHESVDFDCDSQDELLVESNSAAYYLAPQSGGTLFEWDARPVSHNLVSVMTRRPEAYHVALRNATDKPASESDPGEAQTIHDVVRLKEPGLEKLLFYDWYRRSCLVDHFLRAGTTRESFASCTFGESGDFVDRPYQVQIRDDGAARLVTLRREGHVWSGPDFVPVTVEKTLRVDPNDPGFVATYHVLNPSDTPLHATFGIELNLNLLGGGRNPAAYRHLVGDDVDEDRYDQDADVANVTSVIAGNRYLGIELRLDVSEPATAWWSSIESVSSSEGGFERVHQGSSLLFSWPLELSPGKSKEVVIRATVNR